LPSLECRSLSSTELSERAHINGASEIESSTIEGHLSDACNCGLQLRLHIRYLCRRLVRAQPTPVHDLVLEQLVFLSQFAIHRYLVPKTLLLHVARLLRHRKLQRASTNNGAEPVHGKHAIGNGSRLRNQIRYVSFPCCEVRSQCIQHRCVYHRGLFSPQQADHP
jgi:hypothetical protein